VGRVPAGTEKTPLLKTETSSKRDFPSAIPLSRVEEGGGQKKEHERFAKKVGVIPFKRVTLGKRK